MRIDTPRDLGRYVRERRRRLGRTQAALASAAGVSRRWLSDLEGGKATAEIGLVLRTLRALDVDVRVEPVVRDPNEVDLDALLDGLRTPRV